MEPALVGGGAIASLSCQHCNYKSAKKSNLRIHIHHNHTDRTFICNECDGRFKTSSLLRGHIKSVHSPKAFKCQQCQKMFHTRAHLNSHESQVHRKERRFPCTQCDLKFAGKDGLTYHVARVHSREDRRWDVKCFLCSKIFIRYGHLNRHIRTVHECERRFKCGYCVYAAKEKSTLRRHVKRKHEHGHCDGHA